MNDQYTIDDAIDDIYGVQLIDNTSNEADAARKELIAIVKKLVESGGDTVP